MNEISYNKFKKKVEDIHNRSYILLRDEEISVLEAEQSAELAPLNIVFVGQYSAGKSSLIKMLTGVNDIKIGAGVTTDTVTFYRHKSIEIWDTPGILAGKCEQHDILALEAISKADLLIYVITNELFDDVLAKAFRNLCFEQGRAKDIMIVINKSENDSAEKETKLSAIAQVLEPKIPEDFPIVFTDAQAYFDTFNEDDEEERQELLQISNIGGLTKAIDKFVSSQGIYARLTTPLQSLQATLESKFEALTISDPLQQALVSLLNQNKRIFTANKRDLTKKTSALVDDLYSQIIEQGNLVADAMNGEKCNFEKVQDKAIYECNRYLNLILEGLQTRVSESISDLENELIELANAPASLKISDALNSAREFSPKGEFGSMSSITKEEPNKIASTLNVQLLKSAEKGLSFLAKNVVGDASKTGLKAISGSTLHNAIKEIGGFLGYKFKAWEAVKIADKIGKGAKFLGPAMTVFGIGMQIYDDYQSAEYEKNIISMKREIRKNFKEFADEECLNINKQINELIAKCFDESIYNIDTSLNEIRKQNVSKSEIANSLDSLLVELRQLRNQIHQAY